MTPRSRDIPHATKSERHLAQQLRDRGLPLLAQQAEAIIDQLAEAREALRDGLTVFAGTEWARKYQDLWNLAAAPPAEKETPND